MAFGRGLDIQKHRITIFSEIKAEILGLQYFQSNLKTLFGVSLAEMLEIVKRTKKIVQV
jgi:hypothetical protein